MDRSEQPAADWTAPGQIAADTGPPRDVAITSDNGTHGTICGPWPSGKHLAAPAITVRMIPSDPSSTCRNFSVLLSGTS